MFIRNTSPYTVTYPLISKTDEGEVIQSNVSFPCKQVDVAGMVIHTGFTEIDEETYNKLLELKLFQTAIKNGVLVKYDEAPPEALKDSQLLDAAQEQIKKLTERVKELEEQLINSKRKSSGPKSSAPSVEDIL